MSAINVQRTLLQMSVTSFSTTHAEKHVPMANIKTISLGSVNLAILYVKLAFQTHIAQNASMGLISLIMVSAHISLAWITSTERLNHS